MRPETLALPGRRAVYNARANVDRSWWIPTYAIVVLGLYTFAPELRRVINLFTGYQPIDPTSILPLLAITPLALALLRSEPTKFSRALVFFALTWVAAFGYAACVGLVYNGPLGAIYSLATFLLPMIFGLWVAGSRLTTYELYERIGRAVLLFATIAAVYGIIQWIVVPPWDALWMNNVGMESIGKALPFQVRAFGPLNAPGPFGDFMVLGLLFSLPLVRGRGLWWLLGILAMIVALGLSLVRADYIALALGVLLFTAFSNRREGAAILLGLLIAAFGGYLTFTATNTNGDDNVVLDRVLSLGNLNNDYSAQDRLEQSQHAWLVAQGNPIGEGLGAVGTATKLDGGDPNHADILDNGWLSRAVEMGLPGGLLYGVVVVFGLFATIAAWHRARRALKWEIVPFFAASIAVQAALLFMDISGDHHLSYSGTLFWLALALALRDDRPVHEVRS